MASIDYIISVVDQLLRKHKTRDPFVACDELGINVRDMDLGQDMKAYYFYQSRIRNIILNERVSAIVRRILAAHELGHDRLHKEIAMLSGFQEIELFDRANPSEYEANLFTAEFLIDDHELMDLLNDEEHSFFGVAKELYVPADLPDFKFRVLKHKGYRINAPIIASCDFLGRPISGCFDDDD